MALFPSFLCGLNCIGMHDGGLGKSSKSSSRQQYLVIQQLRESHRKKDASTRGKTKLQKIVPLSISVSPNKASIGDNTLGQPSVRAKLKEQKAAERAARSMAEENNLKSALTHPTILKFLKAFMVAQSTDNMLDFYLDVAEIRGLHRRRYTRGSHVVLL